LLGYRSRRVIRILSIDGGGIRGLIPAILLRELAGRLARLYGRRPIHSYFDLIGGTSAGGLIALGLTLPKLGTQIRSLSRTEPAIDLDRLVGFFEHDGDRVFQRGRFNRLHNLKQAFAEKYDSGPIERILDEIFGDATVADALTNLLITAYDTEKRAPHFFKKRPRRGHWKHDLDFAMKDAARATTAAPTFFEPAYIIPSSSPNQAFCLVDGGVFANNPAMCAYIEARKIFPRAQKYIIVSLGTGLTKRRFTYQEMKKWGYIEWVSPLNGVPLSGMMMDGQSDTISHQLAKLPGVAYYRFDGILEGCSEAIDDAAPKNIEGLKRVANRIIAAYGPELDEVTKALT
jgi:patatin-like phospholipase/acyl hydrolase